jgi:hypothetical protein
MAEASATVEGQVRAHVMADGADAYITGGAELRAHLSAADRASGYRRMATALGIDPGIVPEDDNRPGLLFAEQPGCWFTARDHIRVRILDLLVTRGWFDWRRSGVYALADDRFTSEGDKAVFLAFELCSSLGPVRVLGSTYIRRNRRKTYAALELDEGAVERLRAIFETSREILLASMQGDESFTTRIRELRAEGMPPGLEALLPPDGSDDRLSELCGRMTVFQAAQAAALLEHGLGRLEVGVGWEGFWNELNGRFLGTTVQRFGPLLNRLLLAIRDPIRMSQGVIDALGLDPHQPIKIAGAALDEETYRMIWYDPAIEGFYVERGDEQVPVAWDEVRGVAMAGGAASPSGMLEYLLLAATGHYLIVDPGDGFQYFHALACALHEEYTGRKFPWITFSAEDVDAGHDANSFLEAFHPRFARRVDGILQTFLDE